MRLRVVHHHRHEAAVAVFPAHLGHVDRRIHLLGRVEFCQRLPLVLEQRKIGNPAVVQLPQQCQLLANQTRLFLPMQFQRPEEFLHHRGGAVVAPVATARRMGCRAREERLQDYQQGDSQHQHSTTGGHDATWRNLRYL